MDKWLQRRHRIFLSTAFDECWTIHSWKEPFQLSLAILFCVSRFSLEFTIQAIWKSFDNKKNLLLRTATMDIQRKEKLLQLFPNFFHPIPWWWLFHQIDCNFILFHVLGLLRFLFSARRNHRQHAIHQFVLVTLSIVLFMSAFEAGWLQATVTKSDIADGKQLWILRHDKSAAYLWNMQSWVFLAIERVTGVLWMLQFFISSKLFWDFHGSKTQTGFTARISHESFFDYANLFNFRVKGSSQQQRCKASGKSTRTKSCYDVQGSSVLFTLSIERI